MGEAKNRGTFLERRQQAIAIEREVVQLRKVQALLIAHVRGQPGGTVTVPMADLEAMGETDGITYQREGDAVRVTFVTARRPHVG